MPTDNPMDLTMISVHADGPLSLSCSVCGKWIGGTTYPVTAWTVAALIRMAEAHVREAHPDVSRETSGGHTAGCVAGVACEPYCSAGE